MEDRQTTEQDMKGRLAFLGMEAHHGRALAEAQPVLSQALATAVDQFYDRMEAWPQLTRMFDDPSRKKYARDTQIKHWQRLFTGTFDQTYVESVRKIGKTHSRIGLEPRWFLGGYAQVLATLQHAYVAHWTAQKSKDPGRAEALALVLQSLSMAITLDMDLVISVYLEENQVRHRQNLDQLSDTFRTSVSHSISAASGELQTAAHQIGASAVETVSRSRQVDEAARNANQSVQSMAAAMEEMARSITEIRSQTDRSTKVSEQAVSLTRGIDKVMKGLLDSVARIDDSVAQINDIAARTNILAINASIEAARAGVVGRGFAVVASEVRNLASQTVGATESIGSQIAALKNSARDSVGAVDAIVKVIQDIDQNTATIAAAVEEQGTVTREIARNAQTAAEGSVTVAENIEVVARSANETGAVAKGLEAVLARMDEDFRVLNQQVDAFLGQLK